MGNKKVPLKVELSGSEKYFYDYFSPEGACNWLEGFINGTLVTGERLGELFEKYAGKEGISASAIGAIQKLIDTVRAAENAKENPKE